MPQMPTQGRVPDHIGAFAIERELGRGGMGVVYLATQTGLNRPVALKVLSDELSDDAAAVPAPNASTDAPASAAPSTTGAPTSTTTATQQATQQTVTSYTCWDGSAATSPTACAAPRTAAEAISYLDYVFANQSAIGTNCVVTDSTKNYSALTAYRSCSAGKDVDVVVRYWANSSDAHKLYDKRFATNIEATYTAYIGGTKTDGSVKVTKHKTDSPPRLNLVAMWAGGHVALSIFAPSSHDLWTAFGKVRAVLPDQTLGYPATSGSATSGTLEAR